MEEEEGVPTEAGFDGSRSDGGELVLGEGERRGAGPVRVPHHALQEGPHQTGQQIRGLSCPCVKVNTRSCTRWGHTALHSLRISQSQSHTRCRAEP